MAETNDAAKRLFVWLSKRNRDIAETSVDRAAWMAEASYADMLAIFRELSLAGLGEFISGRKGYKTRIKWFYSVRSIGKSAVRQAKVLAEVDVDQLDTQDEDPIKEPDASAEALRQGFKHEYQLRSDVRIELVLPNDFSSREAERVSAWVKTLSLE
jgi:hypothetical protein